VLVHDNLDNRGDLTAYLRSHPGAQHICTRDHQSLYRIAEAVAAAAPNVSGTSLPLAHVRANVNPATTRSMVDRDRETRWHSGPQVENTIVEADLGRVQTVAGIDVLLGPFAADFPRGLVIELSDEPGKWRQVWQGSSAALAYTAALEAPRDLTLKYRFPPSDARIVRMRQTLNDPSYYWSIAELHVLGP